MWLTEIEAPLPARVWDWNLSGEKIRVSRCSSSHFEGISGTHLNLRKTKNENRKVWLARPSFEGMRQINVLIIRHSANVKVSVHIERGDDLIERHLAGDVDG